MNKWQPVETAPILQDVLVARKCFWGNFVGIAQRNGDDPNDWSDDEMGLIAPGSVRAWMQLPELPEELRE